VGCTVDELLERISCEEITEWQAYELAFGEIGSRYNDDALAETIDRLGLLIRIMGGEETEQFIKRYVRRGEQRSVTTEDEEEVISEEEAAAKYF
jgi:hypothetical protein